MKYRIKLVKIVFSLDKEGHAKEVKNAAKFLVNEVVKNRSKAVEWIKEQVNSFPENGINNCSFYLTDFPCYYGKPSANNTLEVFVPYYHKKVPRFFEKFIKAEW